jgi:hypothetical protein
MTINTTFSVGAVLTAAQQNNFPRGLAADIKKSETTDSSITTTEEVMLTLTFSQVSGRNYLFTYIEPNLTGTAATTATVRFRETNLAGGIYNTLRTQVAIATSATSVAQYVYCAGTSSSLTIVATIQAGTGTITATRSSSQIANMFVTDIGTGYVYTT